MKSGGADLAHIESQRIGLIITQAKGKAERPDYAQFMAKCAIVDVKYHHYAASNQHQPLPA